MVRIGQLLKKILGKKFASELWAILFLALYFPLDHHAGNLIE